jgi:hypothetical protein
MNAAAATVGQATVATAIPVLESAIDLEGFVDLLEQSTVQSRLNIRCATVYRVHHPTRGTLILVNTIGETHAVIQC